MLVTPGFPTIEHRRAAEAVADFFSTLSGVSALLLVGSCARGRAAPDSCLDIVALVAPDTPGDAKAELSRRWRDFYESEAVFKSLRQVGKYSHVDLDFTDGRFAPRSRGWTSGPDEFELEIGNTLAYSVTLWQQGDYLDRLKAHWLPYYDDSLRRERLALVRRYCLNNLDHVPLYVDRGLYFQAFHRLYDAFREFLQALFISRQTYPIAYDKWIREQVEDVLGLAELYPRLPRLFEIERFESLEIADKAWELRGLVDEYLI